MRNYALRVIFLLLCIISSLSSAAKTFVIQSFEDPINYDPIKVRGTSGLFIFNNLYNGLYKFNTEKGLIPVGAKQCVYKELTTIECTLNTQFKFSDGQIIEAKHYIWAFQRAINKDSRTTLVELLLPLKNAKDILLGKKPVNALGISTNKKNQLIFKLAEPDSDFLYNLVHPVLSPIPAKKVSFKPNKSMITTGPFKIKNYKVNQFIELEPNPHFYTQLKAPIQVKFSFIAENITALNLYETKSLDLVRIINVKDIPKFKTNKSFVQTPLLRFDYMGFGKRLKKYPELRKAMAHSLQYEQLNKIYHALGIPGCPSLPVSFFTKRPCYRFDKSKFANIKIPKELMEKPLHFIYSERGGESVQQGVEWMQESWRKHLGLPTQISPLESGVFVQTLKMHRADIFRKGVGLDRPTCLAALSVFRKNSRENYIRYNNSKFDKILEQMQITHDSKKSLCTKAVNILLDDYVIIPQGEIYFSMLIRDSFKDWQINSLNQLDLSNLYTH